MNEEQAWILQAQQGSDEAFTRLLEAYQTPVYNLCYRMLGEPEEAEDAAQETFLRAYQNLERYDRARSFATWLLSIAAHYCIDRLRRRRIGFVPLEDDERELELPDAQAPDPEAEAIRHEQERRMQAALAGLDETDRAAIVLRYWHDFSEAEIAENLDLTIPAVKSRLHRARRALASLWQEQEKDEALDRRPYGSPAF